MDIDFWMPRILGIIFVGLGICWLVYKSIHPVHRNNSENEKGKADNKKNIG